MRVFIRQGKTGFPLWFGFPTVFLTGLLPKVIAWQIRKSEDGQANGAEGMALGGITLTKQDARMLARAVRTSAKTLKKAKLPLVSVHSADGDRVTVRL